MDIDENDDSDSEGNTKVQSKKRRLLPSDGSSSPSFAGTDDTLGVPSAGYIVLPRPTNQTASLESLSHLRIAQQLSALDLDQTTEIRVNSRKTINALEVSSPVARGKLLETSSGCCRVDVVAFLPTPVSATTGMIRVDTDFTGKKI